MKLSSKGKKRDINNNKHCKQYFAEEDVMFSNHKYVYACTYSCHSVSNLSWVSSLM